MNPQSSQQPLPGTLSWRLSSHPITLLTFLVFRICPSPRIVLTSSLQNYKLTISIHTSASLLVYLLGLQFSSNFVLIFILTTLLLATDFYYLKNIAGRRLVGLRWWNESLPTSTSTSSPSQASSHWVFESASPADRQINATDSRFFWLALYIQPVLWVVLAVVAILRVNVVWLSLVAIALVLTMTNALAFSRCDRFSQASGIAGGVLGTGTVGLGVARGVVGGVLSRLIRGGS